MNPRWSLIALVLLAGCAHFSPQPLSPADTAAGLDARTLDNPAFRGFLEKNLSRRFETWPPTTWDFATLNLAALYYHPSLDVARAQWDVALGGDKTAAARPNPTVSLIPGYALNSASGTPPWIPMVSFDLPLEIAGKRGHRIAQAWHLSEAARLNIAATAWQVRSNLQSTLIDYSFARQRETLLQKQQMLQERILASLDLQLKAGAVARSELTLTRIAVDQIRLDLADAHQQAADARVRVADAIGISATALDRSELFYDLTMAPPAASDLMSLAVRKQALQSRTDILGALAEYAARQSALQLEIAKQYPDIHLGPGYQYDQGTHKISLSLTAELPLLNQNQGPIAEAEARRTETAARFNALQARVITDIDRAVANYRAAQESFSALDALAASQKERNDAMQGQLKAGAAAQFELLNLQVELGSGELLLLNARLKLQQSFAALENAVQRPIDSTPARLLEQSQRTPATQENQP